MGATALSELEIFQFPATGQQVRTIVLDGEPWFVGADVADALGFSRARDAVRMVEDEDKAAHSVRTPGGTQQATVINESGLYTLILRSNRPEAKAFKRWVTNDVLPQIRMTGRYEPVPQLPQTYAQALRELASTVERAEQAERDVQALAPAAAAWDHLASADGDWSVADAAKILSRDPNIKTGQNRLFTLLYEWGWIYRAGDRHWRANQAKAVDTQRLSVMPASHYHPRTGQLVQDPPQIRVLPKGLVEMHRRLGGSAPLAVQQQLEIGSLGAAS